MSSEPRSDEPRSDEPHVDAAVEQAWAALRAQRAAARDAMRAAAHEGEHPADAVDAEQLRAALAGELDEEQREATLDAALRSGAFDDIALMQATMRAAQDASQPLASSVHSPQRTRRRIRWVGPSSVFALAAVLVVAIWLPRRIAVGNAPVADVRGASGAVELLAPAANAELRDTLQFSWRAVRGATRYELELLDVAGAVIQQVTTSDTAVALPMHDAAALTSAWWVRATLSDGTRVQGTLRLLAPRAKP